MEEYLKCTYPMDKSSAQLTRYATRQLTELDVQYCGLDAMVSLMVGNEARLSLENCTSSSTITILKVGKQCKITFRSREIAEGKFNFMEQGESRGGGTIKQLALLIVWYQWNWSLTINSSRGDDTKIGLRMLQPCTSWLPLALILLK